MSDVMTTADVMREMGWKDPETVHRQIRLKRLGAVPGVKPYRIPRAAFEAFKRGEQPGSLPPREKRRGTSKSGGISWLKDVEQIIKS